MGINGLACVSINAVHGFQPATTHQLFVRLAGAVCKLKAPNSTLRKQDPASLTIRHRVVQQVGQIFDAVVMQAVPAASVCAQLELHSSVHQQMSACLTAKNFQSCGVSL